MSGQTEAEYRRDQLLIVELGKIREALDRLARAGEELAFPSNILAAPQEPHPVITEALADISRRMDELATRVGQIERGETVRRMRV
jgi:hypothetical protein